MYFTEWQYDWIIILLSVLFTVSILLQVLQMRETFELARPRKPGGAIVVGTIHGSTPAVKDMMARVNLTGTQLVADSQYDTVDESVFK
jgi:hypothetical protein